MVTANARHIGVAAAKAVEKSEKIIMAGSAKIVVAKIMAASAGM